MFIPLIEYIQNSMFSSRNSGSKLALYQFINSDKTTSKVNTHPQLSFSPTPVLQKGTQRSLPRKSPETKIITSHKNNQFKSNSPNIVNKNLLKTMENSFKVQNKMADAVAEVLGTTKSSPRKPLKSNILKGSTVQSQKKTGLDESNTQDMSALMASYGALDILQPPQNSKETVREMKHPKDVKSTTRGRTASTTSSEEQNEYDDGATPGPGAYEVNSKPQANFRSKKTSIRSIFYSKMERFTSPPQEETPSHRQQETQKQSPPKQGTKFFMSRMPKFYERPKEKIPPPGYYNTRQTLEHDLVRNILKSSNSVTFVSNIYRSPFKVKKDVQPGPGSYDYNSSPFSDNEFSQQSYFFKSSIERGPYCSSSQKQLQSFLPALGDRKQEIHVKKDDKVFEKDYICEAPPFMSSQDRFPTSKPNYKETLYRPLKATATIKQNVAPFNSSGGRLMEVRAGQGVGVGLYEDLRNWSKKSYNIRNN